MFSLICSLLAVVEINAFEAGYTYKYSYHTTIDSKSAVSSLNKTKNLINNNDNIKNLLDYKYEIKLNVFENEEKQKFVRLNVRILIN